MKRFLLKLSPADRKTWLQWKAWSICIYPDHRGSAGIDPLSHDQATPNVVILRQSANIRGRRRRKYPLALVPTSAATSLAHDDIRRTATSSVAS